MEKTGDAILLKSDDLLQNLLTDSLSESGRRLAASYTPKATNLFLGLLGNEHRWKRKITN